MSTDNWPVDFRYISTRLVTEIVQQHEAARSRWRPTLTTQVKVVAVGLRHRDPDYRNKFDLSRRATEAISDNTGTLDMPGEYVREQLEITPGLLTVLLGWRQSHVEIAAMFAVLDAPEVGSTLVALFGSASNYSGRRPRGSEPSEIPSDVDGLYGIVQRTREYDDPEIKDHYLERDPGHTPESRAELVLGIVSHRFKGYASSRLDVLMKVFYVVDDYRRGSVRFDRVVIGAPVWVATPVPRPLRHDR